MARIEVVFWVTRRQPFLFYGSVNEIIFFISLILGIFDLANNKLGGHKTKNF